MIDVVVMGAGPAGLAVASELAAGGARVEVVAPRPHARWLPNYGAWLDELGHRHVAACVRQVWRAPQVHVDDERSVTLARAYGRFDNDTLQDHLVLKLRRAGGRFCIGMAQDVEHRDDHSRVALSGGSYRDARVVIDATGPRSQFVRRPRQRIAFQSAYGEIVRVKRHPYAAGEMSLMDFRGDDSVPTFLYAMPLAGDRIFVEETSLVAERPTSQMLLRTRLHQRLARMGVEVTDVESRETCLIPMGLGVPPSQRVIAFGTAAAFVHPATGYSLARALRLAPIAARAILGALADAGAEHAAHHAYDAIWPAAARRSWALYRFGMEVLCGFGTEDMRTFLGAFFALPDSSWQPYLSGTATPAEIVIAMLRVLMHADGLRGHLLAATTRAEAKPLLRALLQGGTS